MGFVALYRRYRPTTFDKLIGQDHIVRTLTNQIENGRIGHAYLFTGTRGTGKTSAAKIFAKAINCEHPINGSLCGKCNTCIALSDPSNMDIIEIDAASNNGVNEIRDLREKVQYPPVSGKYKVYIIDEVHMLTGAAFNALLKTLEEPPKHAVFILATTEVHKIPITILSRCMRFDFRLVSTEKIANLISSIYDDIGKKYEVEAVNLIAMAGEGSIRDALSIADTALSYSNGILTYEDVADLLGSCNSEILTNFIKSIVSCDAGKVLENIDYLCGLGKSISVLIKDITSYLRNLLIVKTCDESEKILILPENKIKELKEIAKLTTEERLLRALEVFAESESLLKYSNHARIVFETAAVKATRPDSDYDINALLARIKELENKINSGNIIVKENIEKAIKEEEPIPLSPQKENIDFERISASEIKSMLLVNLRESKEEMLWNVIQSVAVEKKGGMLYLLTTNEGDDIILDDEKNRQIITEALKDLMPFVLQVKRGEKNIALDKIDEATERAKKIFGDDIVIIQD